MVVVKPKAKLTPEQKAKNLKKLQYHAGLVAQFRKSGSSLGRSYLDALAQFKGYKPLSETLGGYHTGLSDQERARFQAVSSFFPSWGQSLANQRMRTGYGGTALGAGGMDPRASYNMIMNAQPGDYTGLLSHFFRNLNPSLNL